MQNFSTMTLREIALQMPQTTRVFEEYNIDYCCGGRKPLSEACEIVGVDAAEVESKLNDLLSAEGGATDLVEDASLAELMVHIVDKHHVFTKNELTNLSPLVDKVVQAHGERHPELIELKRVFAELEAELFPHMMKEETVLFPYIDGLERNTANGLPPPAAPFGTVAHPVKMMTMEHERAGELLSEMRRLSNGFVPPPEACPSYTGLYFRLKDLERDLHEHIHLENNLLFPRAIALEARSTAVATV